MNQIQSSSQRATSSWNRQTSKPFCQTGQMSSTQTIQGSERQDVALSITTKDGDTITLSLASNYDSIYQDDQKYGQGKAMESTMYSTTSQRQFTMTVEGNLDEQERMEVDKVVKTVDQMLNNFVNGRLKPMMAQADKLSDLDTIGDLSLKMSYSRDILVAEHTQVTAGFDPTDITYDRLGQLVAAPRTGTSQTVAPTDSAKNQVTAAADDLTKAMARQLARVREYADRPFSAIKQIFDKYRQQVKNLTSSDAFGPSLIDHMHKKLIDHVLNDQKDLTAGAESATDSAQTLVA